VGWFGRMAFWLGCWACGLGVESVLGFLGGGLLVVCWGWVVGGGGGLWGVVSGASAGGGTSVCCVVFGGRAGGGGGGLFHLGGLGPWGLFMEWFRGGFLGFWFCAGFFAGGSGVVSFVVWSGGSGGRGVCWGFSVLGGRAFCQCMLVEGGCWFLGGSWGLGGWLRFSCFCVAGGGADLSVCLVCFEGSLFGGWGGVVSWVCVFFWVLCCDVDLWTGG